MANPIKYKGVDAQLLHFPSARGWSPNFAAVLAGREIGKPDTFDYAQYAKENGWIWDASSNSWVDPSKSMQAGMAAGLTPLQYVPVGSSQYIDWPASLPDVAAPVRQTDASPANPLASLAPPQPMPNVGDQLGYDPYLSPAPTDAAPTPFSPARQASIDYARSRAQGAPARQSIMPPTFTRNVPASHPAPVAATQTVPQSAPVTAQAPAAAPVTQRPDRTFDIARLALMTGLQRGGEEARANAGLAGMYKWQREITGGKDARNSPHSWEDLIPINAADTINRNATILAKPSGPTNVPLDVSNPIAILANHRATMAGQPMSAQMDTIDQLNAIGKSLGLTDTPSDRALGVQLLARRRSKAKVRK